jgi:predicted RNase H-like nuclease
MRHSTKVSAARTYVGVDGCRDGWLAVVARRGAPLSAIVYAHFADLLSAVPASAFIGVDMPIGIPDRSPRACEFAARKLLGWPRSSSVFDVPPRACLEARTYAEACGIRARIEGKRLSRQSFGILPKIAEVDRELRTDPRHAGRVFEIHPEVAFAVWNNGRAMRHPKRSSAGQRERRALIESAWPRQLPQLRAQLRGERYALDDLHDALAVLRSVRRAAAGRAVVLGDRDATDRFGLPMRISA